MGNIKIVVQDIYLRIEWLPLTLLAIVTLAIIITTIFLVKKELRKNDSS